MVDAMVGLGYNIIIDLNSSGAQDENYWALNIIFNTREINNVDHI